jgi:hypothetical protein
MTHVHPSAWLHCPLACRLNVYVIPGVQAEQIGCLFFVFMLGLHLGRTNPPTSTSSWYVLRCFWWFPSVFLRFVDVITRC